MTTRRGATLALAACLFASAAATADEPAEDGNQAEALERLEKVCRQYASLPAYRDEGRFVAVGTLDGRDRLRRRPMSLAFARPNKLALRFEGLRVVSDGKTLRTILDAARKYQDAPAPAELDYNGLFASPAAALFTQNPTFLTIDVVLHMAFGKDTVAYLMNGTDGITREPARHVGARALTPLLIDQQQGPDFRLLVDDATEQLAGIELVVAPEDAEAGLPPGSTIELDRVAWRAGRVEAAAPVDLFSIEVPDHYRRTDSLRDDIARLAIDRAYGEGEPADLAGEVAPALEARRPDGTPLGRPAGADALGRATLVLFWSADDADSRDELAPCLALAGPNLRVLAVNVDEPDDDRPAPAGPARINPKDDRIVLDPGGRAAERFRVVDLPAWVLIDEEGLVRGGAAGRDRAEAVHRAAERRRDSAHP